MNWEELSRKNFRLKFENEDNEKKKDPILSRRFSVFCVGRVTAPSRKRRKNKCRKEKEWKKCRLLNGIINILCLVWFTGAFIEKASENKMRRKIEEKKTDKKENSFEHKNWIVANNVTYIMEKITLYTISSCVEQCKRTLLCSLRRELCGARHRIHLFRIAHSSLLFSTHFQ